MRKAVIAGIAASAIVSGSSDLVSAGRDCYDGKENLSPACGGPVQSENNKFNIALQEGLAVVIFTATGVGAAALYNNRRTS